MSSLANFIKIIIIEICKRVRNLKEFVRSSMNTLELCAVYRSIVLTRRRQRDLRFLDCLVFSNQFDSVW